MDLNILPPDTETFVTKKQTSERQKAHLKKAREIAKQRQIKPKNEEINDNQSVENESEDKEIEEQQPIITKPTQKAVKKLPAKKKTDKYRLTAEEIAEREDLEKFEKFMKHMNKYEEVKAKIKQEEKRLRQQDRFLELEDFRQQRDFIARRDDRQQRFISGQNRLLADQQIAQFNQAQETFRAGQRDQQRILDRQ